MTHMVQPPASSPSSAQESESSPYLSGSLSGKRLIDVVGALLHGLPELKIAALSPEAAVLLTPGEGVIRVFLERSNGHENEAFLVELVDRCLKENPPQGTDVVLVGGGDRESQILEREVPRLLQHPFRVHHVSSGDQLLSYPLAARKAKGVRSALEAVRRLSDKEVRQILAEEVRHKSEFRKEGRRRQQFFAGMLETKPRVTRALLVALVFFYFLQLTRIPSSDGLAAADGYLRMGALSRPHLLMGEWWRLLSAGFLHGGLMHLGSNSFVLYLLGGQTEKIIGSRRFFLVYFASLVGGSLASASLLQGYSVGASGAIWGILGAQAALGFGRPAILPESIRGRVRSAALQNLGLNLMITFMVNLDPNSAIRIDWAAHLGGGIAGALVLGSGVLFLRQEGGERGAVSEPSWLRPATASCLALTVLALFLAVTRSSGL